MKYTVRFQTDLNESMIMIVFASSFKSATRKIKKEFPSAFDFH